MLTKSDLIRTYAESESSTSKALTDCLCFQLDSSLRASFDVLHVDELLGLVWSTVPVGRVLSWSAIIIVSSLDVAKHISNIECSWLLDWLRSRVANGVEASDEGSHLFISEGN